jgi:SAM-dependent methyltransferase
MTARTLRAADGCTWDEFFDQASGTYHRKAFGAPGLAAVSAHELSFLRSQLAAHAAPGARSLDVGAGTGRIIGELRAAGCAPVAVDAAPGMLAALRSLGVPAVQALVGSPLPFPDASFDVVTCFRVLKYVHDLDAAVAELGRVLRPGGLLVIEHVNARSAARLGYRGAELRFVTAAELRCAAERGRLDVTAVAGGTRLPHPVWERSRGRSLGLALALERAGRVVAGELAGSRSLLLSAVRR